MKKIEKIRFLLTKNKQAKRAIALVCFVVLMLGGVFATVKILDEKERVSAHPTNPIKLDEGGTDEFTLPIDGTKLEEQTLKDLTPDFDDYVQGEDLVPSVSKSNVVSFGSESINNNSIQWSIKDIRETVFGNYLVLYGASGFLTGGLLKVSVFNKDGLEIASSTRGTLLDASLRIQAGFYDVENNEYLIGTNEAGFYKCTVSNESSSDATVEISGLNTNNVDNRRQLEVHGVQNVITDQKINNSPLITATSIYVHYSDGREGFIKGRIPIGTLDNQDWLSDNMTGEASHEYSLENITVDEMFTSGNQASIGAEALYLNSNGLIVGLLNYGNSSSAVQTIQIFSQEEVTVDGNDLKKREFAYYDNHNIGGKAQVLWDICTDENIYFTWRTPTETQLIEVDLSTFQSTIIRRFPKNTRLLMRQNDDGDISYYGSTTSLDGEFYSKYYSTSLDSSYYYIQGIMRGVDTTEPAKVKNMRAMEISDWLNPTHIVSIDANHFFIGGTTMDTDSFPDAVRTVLEDGQIDDRASKNQNAFTGLITLADDWSPVIKKAPDISVNLDDPAIGKPSSSNYRDWNTLDRWLITGSKNGVVTDADAIKVYDHFDSNDSLIGSTPQSREEWLQKRINRNPNNLTAAIEWNSLGFDSTKSGAQLVTYFITDTQGQAAVTSRWVNKKTDQTIEEDDYCLDAQNFHISVIGLDSAIPDDATFKRLAKTMAWNKTSTETDEDGTDAAKLSNKVTIDATQLQALRDATVAKPYPVDVTYRPETGVEIKNRVWVFVTTTNTLPNSATSPATTPQDTNGLVFYGDDYSLPYRMRNDHSNTQALTSGNIKVYDYFDSTHETDAELPTLADATKNANKLVVDLPTIQNSLEPETVRPSISYTWEGATDANHTKDAVTLGYVDVELTGNALLHIRQVVLDSSNEIVVPTKGYFEIRNLLFDQTDPMNPPVLDPNYLATFTGKSGDDISNNEFTSVVVPTSHIPSVADQIQVTVVVPEFYQYLGYWCTDEGMDPGGVSHLTNTNYIDLPLDMFKGMLNDQGEFWITMFIKPNTDNQRNTKTPQPYSWDYEKNDLGKIKTK